MGRELKLPAVPRMVPASRPIWKKMGIEEVWDSEECEEAISVFRLRPDYKEEPGMEIAEYVVHKGSSDIGRDLLVYVFDVEERLLYEAVNDPCFVGFKYEDGKTYPHPRLYVGEGKIKNVIGVDFGVESDLEVLTPTHVLFKGTK